MIAEIRQDMEINVLIDEGFEQHLDIDWLRSIVEQVLLAENTGSNVEAGLVITSQEKVHQLNRYYLGEDEPTDVLSFSAREEISADTTPFITPPDGMIHLGEVLISYPQAVIQAKEHHHSTQKEVAILIIHGIFHLLGYEHDTPELQHIMSIRECEILCLIEESRCLYPNG